MQARDPMELRREGGGGGGGRRRGVKIKDNWKINK